ncbi:YiiD C-terminal domain-containing protein [bacterium SCSIO 12741]|nr:YiiD C-terminal domain-containing protein [bacterium SCSIO 12741]
MMKPLSWAKRMKQFSTDKKESRKSRWKRFQFNLFPAYRRTGAKVEFISGDWMEVHISLRLKWSTRNYVGTVFGGSIYAALDPIYMLQLIHILGKDYVVWDKRAEIHFIRPIKKKVTARFLLNSDQIEQIKKDVAEQKEVDFDLQVRFQNSAGKTHALVNKTLYVSERSYYQDKIKKRKS